MVQYFVNIYNIPLKSLLLSIFLALHAMAKAHNTEDSTLNIQDIRNKFNDGVNLSLYEHYWEHPDSLLKADIAAKLEAVHKAGFTSIRLPVAYDLFLLPHSNQLRPQLIERLKEVRTICSQLHISLVITYHYGKLTNDNDLDEREKVIAIWKQVQNAFKGVCYDSLVFNLYNEPTLNRDNWKRDVTYIAKTLRKQDASRYYIIGGTNYNSIDELRELGNINVDKVLYEFHFYEPFIFTHQGADWTDGKTKITNLPYPYKRKEMPQVSNDAIKSSADDYERYPDEANKQFVKDRLKEIVKYCRKHDMPVICTEAGVITAAPEQYRNNYLQDITSILYELAVPTILWDYDQKFSVVDGQGKPLHGVQGWLKPG